MLKIGFYPRLPLDFGRGGDAKTPPPSGPNLHWDQLGRVAWCVEDVPGFLSLCVVPQHTTEARVC